MSDNNIGNISDTQKIQKEILWGLYQELRIHARHSETLRSTMNNYMLIIASALITVIISDNKINILDLPLSLLVCFLGLLSGLFSLSYTERYQRNRERAEEFLKQLDNIFFKEQSLASIAQLKARADKTHNSNKIYFFANKFNTHVFWSILPLVVFVIGCVLTVLCFLGK
jgi:hypothetical protein